MGKFLEWEEKLQLTFCNSLIHSLKEHLIFIGLQSASVKALNGIEDLPVSSKKVPSDLVVDWLLVAPGHFLLACNNGYCKS